MARLEDKKTGMRKQKPKGLSNYCERLISKKSNDYCEQLVSMGSIKRLIEITTCGR